MVWNSSSYGVLVQTAVASQRSLMVIPPVRNVPSLIWRELISASTCTVIVHVAPLEQSLARSITTLLKLPVQIRACPVHGARNEARTSLLLPSQTFR